MEVPALGVPVPAPDTWVEVDGTLAAAGSTAEGLSGLDVASVRGVPRPAQPYL